MTPTLALIVQREDAIAGFVPETFYTVQLRCGFTASSERITQRSDAERLAQACCGQLLTVKHIQHRPRAEKPPRLYDLTTLQREANRVYGFTAQQTLDYAQQLYEKKLITYPRTDSKYLTHDMAEILPLLVQGVSARMPCMTGLDLPVHAPHVIRDEKVSDHHAIIPTRSMLRAELDGLPAGEADILNLIAARLICAVSDEYRYDDTEVTLECAGHPFTARGRAIHQMGWQIPLNTFRGSLGSRILPREDVKQLPELTVGQQLKRAEASVQESQTTPPRHYTEDSLLAAMENAGRSDMPADAERRGLGTPATRAAILEKLVRTGLAERQTAQRVQQLLPTAKGRTLIAVMPEQLKSPAMTAEWEQRLHQIERGAASPDSFMADIHAMLDGLVRTAKPDPDAAKHFPSGHESLGICPVCGTAVSETPKGFFCENRACRFGLWKDNRFLASIGRPPTAEMVSALLREGQVQLTGLQSRKTQKNDQAILLLETDEAGQARLRFDHQKKG